MTSVSFPTPPPSDLRYKARQANLRRIRLEEPLKAQKQFERDVACAFGRMHLSSAAGIFQCEVRYSALDMTAERLDAVAKFLASEGYKTDYLTEQIPGSMCLWVSWKDGPCE